jgi:hypothetical protein
MFKAAVRPKAEAGCKDVALKWYDNVPKDLLKMPPKPVAPIEVPKPVVDQVKEEYDAEEEELSR